MVGEALRFEADLTVRDQMRARAEHPATADKMVLMAHGRHWNAREQPGADVAVRRMCDLRADTLRGQHRTPGRDAGRCAEPIAGPRPGPRRVRRGDAGRATGRERPDHQLSGVGRRDLPRRNRCGPLPKGRRFLYFDGRTDDWIRKDGENFSAHQVARLAAEFPGVALAAAYGVPCALSDGLVMVALEMGDGSASSPTPSSDSVSDRSPTEIFCAT